MAIEGTPVESGSQSAPETAGSCPASRCATPFARITIGHIVRGGTRVEWTLRKDFTDPLPHTFQLQVGKTPHPEADDWEDVGLPVADSFYAIDDQQRVFGQTLWTHYRVALTTALGEYVSEPVFGMGLLPRADWLKARLIERDLRRYAKDAWAPGYLLKRRFFGAPCDCLDIQTGETTIPEHQTCYGTGFQGGYFAPLSCVDARFDSLPTHEHLDDIEGSVNPIVVPAYMLGAPQLVAGDVWVRRSDDIRFRVHSARRAVGIRGVVISQYVELHQIPLSDVVYQIPIPERDEELA